MDPRLQRLIDRQEILDVLHQYAHAADRGDLERLTDVYHPVSFDNHGSYRGDGRTFAAHVCDNVKVRETMSHLMGQSQISVDGDSAGAETYFNATIQRLVDDVRYVDMMGGRYVDRLERRDGEWRILDRICTCEWSMTLKVDDEWHERGLFVQGVFNKSDVSYPVLGLG